MNSPEVENWFYQRGLIDVFYLIRDMMPWMHTYKNGEWYYYRGHLSNYVTLDTFNYQDLIKGYEMIPLQYNPLKTKELYYEDVGSNFRLLQEIYPCYVASKLAFLVVCRKMGDLLYGLSFDEETLKHIESCLFKYDRTRYTSSLTTSKDGIKYYPSGKWFVPMLKMNDRDVRIVITTKNQYDIKKAYLYYQFLEVGQWELRTYQYQWHE